MNVNLKRIVAEDEAACAGVEEAARATRDRLEAERRRLQEERDARRRMLSARVDAAVARILADAERDVAVRRAHRQKWLKEHDRRADGRFDVAAGAFVGIIPDRPRKKTL